MAAKGYIEITVEDWTDLKAQIAVLQAGLEDIKTNHLDHMYAELKMIRTKMSTYRPPWSVVALLTILSSLCVGLIVHAVF